MFQLSGFYCSLDLSLRQVLDAEIRSSGPAAGFRGPERRRLLHGLKQTMLGRGPLYSIDSKKLELERPPVHKESYIHVPTFRRLLEGLC